MASRAPSVAIALGSLVVSACGPDFASLGDWTLRFSAQEQILWATIDSEESHGCPVLSSDFAVKVNGQPLDVERGGTRYTGMQAGIVCVKPGFGFLRPVLFTQ